MIKLFRQAPVAIVFAGGILAANVAIAPTPPTIDPIVTPEAPLAPSRGSDPVVTMQDGSALHWTGLTDF